MAEKEMAEQKMTEKEMFVKGKMENTVLKVMNEVMKNNFGNPSSIHSFGRESRSIIELTRKNISEELNVKPSEIIFTS